MRAGFLCECSARRCHRRLLLPASRYDAIRRAGAVLHEGCAAREQRTVLLREGEVTVCYSGIAKVT